MGGPDLTLRLLGACAASARGQPLPAPSARGQALLAYLALHPGPQPRACLAPVFWPDTTDAQARTNLRRELHHLQRVLPEGVLVADARTLEFRGTSDVGAFRSALASGDLEAAVSAYGGDLAPECQDEWLLEARERLREEWLDAAESLAARLEKEGRLREALARARSVLAADRLRESAHRMLIRLLVRSGDRAAATNAWRECERVLRDELGVEPDPATRAALELPSRPAPRAVAPPPADPLVGREPECAAIRAWLDGPPGRLLMLTGEPGIGKSRLLEELDREARGRGALVLAGRAYEAERTRAYGIWVDMLRALPPSVVPAELLPLLAKEGGPGAADRGGLFEAAAALLVPEGAMLVLLLDDVQWLDEASTALLHYLLRLHLERATIRVAAAVRSGEVEENRPVHRLVAALAREGRLRTLAVPPLPPAAAARLAGVPEPQAEAFWRDCGGNPLFALELARSPAGSGSLPGLVSARLESLGGAARDVVCWAAALGRSFDPALVARVSGRSLIDLLQAMEELERRGLMRPTAGNYDFAHDVVREVAYGLLSGPRRRMLHLQIARILEADPSMADEVARHAALAGEADLAARAHLEAARRCLAVFAFVEAGEHARRGFEQSAGLPAAERVPLQIRLLTLAVDSGLPRSEVAHVDAAVRALVDEATMLGLEAEQGLALTLHSNLHYVAGNPDEVWRTSLRAAEAGRGASLRTQAHLLAHGGACLAAVGRDLPRARALLHEAEQLSERVDLDLPDLTFGLGLVCVHDGDYGRGRRLLERALGQMRSAHAHPEAALCLVRLAMLELLDGKAEGALRRARELQDLARRIPGGSEGALATALAALASEDEPWLEEALGDLRVLDSRRALAFVQNLAAEADLRAGRPMAARARAEEALQAARALADADELAIAATLLDEAGGWSPELEETLATLAGRTLSRRAREIMTRRCAHGARGGGEEL